MKKWLMMVSVAVLMGWGATAWYQPYDKRVANLINHRDEAVSSCGLSGYLESFDLFQSDVRGLLLVGQTEPTDETVAPDWNEFESQRVEQVKSLEAVKICLFEKGTTLIPGEPFKLETPMREIQEDSLAALLVTDKDWVEAQLAILEPVETFLSQLETFEAMYDEPKRSVSIPYFQALGDELQLIDEAWLAYETSFGEYVQRLGDYFEALIPPEDPYKLDGFYE